MSKDAFQSSDSFKETLKESLAVTGASSITINALISYRPEEFAEPTAYSPMLQGTSTNRLAQIGARTMPTSIDAVTGRAVIDAGSLTIFIEQYNSLASGLRISTHKLLDALTIQLTKQNDYRGNGEPNTSISLPLDEYMALCGIPLTKASKDKTRRTVKEDLEILYNISLEWSENKGKKKDDYTGMRIIDFRGFKGGNILVNFSRFMATYLTQAYIMQYPHALFKLDARNGNAYALGRKLALHASMDNNRAKGTNDIISVRALLEVCPDIPSYDDVKSTGRQVEQRIIKPFQEALDALQDSRVIRWHYCKSLKEKLDKSEVDIPNYDTFIGLFVSFKMLNAPDQTARLKAKAEKAVPKDTKKKRPPA